MFAPLRLNRTLASRGRVRNTMLKRFRNNNGQAISAEVVVTFVLVVATLMLISTYVRRTLQGRTRDAMVHARDEGAAGLGAVVSLQYEPYYLETNSQTNMDSTDTETIGSGGSFTEDRHMEKAAVSSSSQAPPKEAY
jgi:hypothetical protein